MSQEILIRPFKISDEENIVKLLVDAFNGWPHFNIESTPLEHWKWKYNDNPKKGRVIAIAEKDGKIIGVDHGYYLNIKIGEEVLLSGQATDLAVDANFRGQGIMGKVSRFKKPIMEKEKVKITYGLSSHQRVLAHDLKDGRLNFPYALRHYIKINDIRRHLKILKSDNKLLKETGYNIFDKWSKLKNIINRKNDYHLNDFKISDIMEFDNSFDIFWNDVKGEYDFIVERSNEYLNWRYCDKRGGDYRVKKAYDEDRLLGYAVTRVNRYLENYPIGYLVDLLALPGRADVTEALMMDALTYFSGLKVNAVHALAIQGHRYEELLSKNNFVKLTDYQILHNIIDTGLDLTQFTSAPSNRMHFVWGDSDWI